MGNAILLALIILYLAGILLALIFDPVWLWLSVGPVAVFLIIWGLAWLAERTLKGWKVT